MLWGGESSAPPAHVSAAQPERQTSGEGNWVVEWKVRSSGAVPLKLGNLGGGNV